MMYYFSREILRVKIKRIIKLPLIIRSFFILLLFSKFLFSIPADVEDISNRKYFPAVLKAIQESQKSIKASLYYISYFKSNKGKVNVLLNALFDASKRGVKVEVILDRSIDFSGAGDMSKKNIRSFSYLKRNGIKVFYDDMETLSHSKYLIIDEKVVIVGSFNWSESSLIKNREASVLIRSTEIAKKYLKLFDDIPKFLPEPVKDAIPIPREFIRNKKLAAKMIMNVNPRAFDLYLWLQKLSFEQQSNMITLTEKEILDNIYKGNKVTYRRNSVIQDVMSRYLKFYRKKYDFIKSYKRNKQKTTLTIELFKTNESKFNSIYLSKLYWQDKWYDRLDIKAKYCILYVLDKTESGRMGKYFSQKQWDSVREFSPSHSVFSYGLTELQRFNLVEKNIYASEKSRTPNDIILNEFYIYSDFQKKLKKLEDKTDKKLFQIVSKIANLVNEPCDLKVYKELISLGNKFGLKVLQDSLIEIEEHKSGISPYKRYDYVVGMIKNKGRGE